MKLGKLTNDDLKRRVLAHVGLARPDVVLRPGIGEDCGGVRFGEEVCVLTTDPITAVAEGAGALCVQVCLNDIASSGAQPVAMLLTLLAPPSATLQQIESVQREAADEAARFGVEIVGGHTEVTDAVTRLVLSGTIVGRAAVGAIVPTSGARPGDTLVLTGQAGLEGTYLLCRSRADVRARLTPEQLAEAAALKDQLTVMGAGLAAARCGATAMHDCTEGGVLGAAWEMACASHCGLQLDEAAVPVRPLTRRICRLLRADPLRLIASGAMLVACAPDAADHLVAALHSQGIEACAVGRFTDEPLAMAPPEGDELYAALSAVLNTEDDN